MQSFMPTRFFVFKIQAIKNGFAGPKSFRGFRETGPRTEPLLKNARAGGTRDFSCTRLISKVCFIFTEPLPQSGQKDETVVKIKLTNVYPSQGTFH